MYVDLSGEVSIVGKNEAEGWKAVINYGELHKFECFEVPFKKML